MSYDGVFEQEKKNKEAKVLKDELSNKEKLLINKERTKKLNDIEVREHLNSLKELVNKGVIDESTIKQMVEKTDKVDLGENKKVIEQIFEKIDEIENLKDVDKYLPEELRLTKQEYMQAYEDEDARISTLKKLDMSLTHLVEQIRPDSAIGLNLFAGFLYFLDKNLIMVQENTIDIKESLEKKGGNKIQDECYGLSFIKKIICIIKKIFSS